MMRKIIIAVLSATELIFLHMSGGYIYRALSGAYLAGEKNAHFVGYYMLAAPFLAGFVICGAVLALFIVKEIKSKKKPDKR